MRSVTSWFNATLFKKNLTRFWPVWAAYLLIWLFVFPINLLLDYDDPRDVVYFAHRQVLTLTEEAGLVMALVFSLFAAVAVWSYLCNNRSACLMHTLPIQRKGLFLTNFLSGLTFMVGPNLLIGILTLLAELAVGYVDVWSLVVWFVSVSLMELFFFSFATLCAMCTGHILGLPALYAVFNGLVAGVVALVEMALNRFVFGYDGGIIEGGLVKFLTPLWLLESNVEVRYDRVNGERVIESAWLSGVGFILVYAAIGLILAALAYILYRRRHMERAGDVITVGWMRPVFRYGVAFCCALAFGTILFEIFRGKLPDTAWTLLLLMLICGAVGFFIAQMLLEKSFRVLRCWKGYIPLLCAMIVLVCVMEFDLTGYEKRVPNTAEVERVEVFGIHTMPYDDGNKGWVMGDDPEMIESVREIHQIIIDSKREIEKSTSEIWMVDSITEKGYSVVTKDYHYIHVVYTMKNGEAFSRSYTVPIYAAEFENPQSLSAKVDALVNRPEQVAEAYGLIHESAENIVEMSLSGPYYDEEIDSRRMKDIPVNKEAYETVLKAIMADFAEGNIGRRYLMDSEERMNNCFVNDLTITFYRGKTENNAERTETVEMSMAMPVPADTKETAPGTESIEVTLQTTSKHTLAALRELGVLKEPVVLMTQAQNSIFYNQEKLDGEVWQDIDMEPFAEEIIGK